MKILSIVGARPNFMKVAPIIRAIDSHNAAIHQSPITNHQPPVTNHPSPVPIHHILVHTGQHYDYEMSQVFFQDLKLPQPDYHLGVGSGTHAEQTGRVLIEVERVLMKEKPDLLVVVGDVNSTLAAALAAAKLHIPVAHVEAGVRSDDKTMPEEINRLLTDHISQYLFTTSEYEDENLRSEGIAAGRVFRVGNIMADSLLHSRELAMKSNALARLDLRPKGYALATLHRPGNVDQRESLSAIIGALLQISERLPVVFPVHPRTQKNLKDFGLLDQPPVTNHRSLDPSHHLLIISPLGYLDFLDVEMHAQMVITDSGGVQVETTILNVPCLTLLDAPVWPITHDQGTNVLVGSDSRRLTDEASKILDGHTKKGRVPKLWDGQVAERIVNTLAGSAPDGLPAVRPGDPRG
jgi:UDP-N-acetylglucosamine 2-epimerase (non-hydrolysing)